VVIDYIGQDYFAKNLEVVAKDGRIVILALLSGSVVSGDLQIAPILRKRISICGSNLRGRDLAYQSLLMEELVRRVMPGLRSGVFKVPIDRVFSWTDITQAHQLMESNTTKGKIVCLVE
jgi:NADPH:quinone reductase-like Zn-dependent oxidoreductase